MPIRSAFALAAILMLALPPLDLVRASGGDAPPAPRRVEAAGVENLFRLSAGLYSGAQPEGDVGFEALKRLGIRTIVSVDGSRPDVEAARRLGLRYVHLPVGYEGIPRERAVRLVKAMHEFPGPVFVHCHHGQHRGPAAAAICATAVEGWDRQTARSWLEQAGTDPKYKGLFAAVDGFVPPTAEELAEVEPGDLPERAEVPALVEVMVEVDATWDRLKAARKAGFRATSDHPDLDPPHEAAMLAEHFREANRREDAKTGGGEFSRRMADAEQAAAGLEAAIRTFRDEPNPARREEAESAFAKAGRSCTACHARLRDVRGRASE